MAADAARKIEPPFQADSHVETHAEAKVEIQDIEVTLPGRDRLHLHLEVYEGEVLKARLTGSGCPELLKALVETRPTLKGRVSELPLPRGTGHAAILVRELILKARGEWKFPYTEEELCHCRAVPTAKVDQAIVGGCHTVFAVARQTSAGTSCGNCRYDTEQIIAYRLGRQKGTGETT